MPKSESTRHRQRSSGATGLHPVVADAESLYRAAKPVEDGRYLLRRGPILKLRVAPSSRAHALELADSLFRAAEARGHPVKLVDGERGGACVVVQGQPIDVTIREEAKQVPHVPTKQELEHAKRWPSSWMPKYDLRPTGVLSIVLENVYDIRARWTEGKRWNLSKGLDMVLDGIEAAGAKRRAQQEENERRERAWEARRQREIEEARRVDQLQRHRDAWRTARDVRAYVAHMWERIHSTGIVVEPDGELAAWLQWALDYAERIDPAKALGSASSERRHGVHAAPEPAPEAS